MKGYPVKIEYVNTAHIVRANLVVQNDGNAIDVRVHLHMIDGHTEHIHFDDERAARNWLEQQAGLKKVQIAE